MTYPHTLFCDINPSSFSALRQYPSSCGLLRVLCLGGLTSCGRQTPLGMQASLHARPLALATSRPRVVRVVSLAGPSGVPLRPSGPIPGRSAVPSSQGSSDEDNLRHIVHSAKGDLSVEQKRPGIAARAGQVHAHTRTQMALCH